jgi:hypothetical protein
MLKKDFEEMPTFKEYKTTLQDSCQWNEIEQSSTLNDNESTGKRGEVLLRFWLAIWSTIILIAFFEGHWTHIRGWILLLPIVGFIKWIKALFK